jgi:hypothetical protein
MLDRRTAIRSIVAVALALGALTAGAGAASADDHLFDAAHSSGVDERGFTNPVAGNPSGTSGAAAQPGTVPGLGNPNTGADQGMPSFDCVSLAERLAARSEGVGPSCG